MRKGGWRAAFGLRGTQGNGQTGRRSGALAALTAASLFSASGANAAEVIYFGPDQWLSLGFGLRSSFTSAWPGPNGRDSLQRANMENFRLYGGASFNKYLKATLNGELTDRTTIQVLDGYAQFEPMDEINVWGGRMLPPSDRANLDGPYFLLNWSYPGVVSRYPQKVSGRMDGGTIWGKVFDKRLVYSVGVYDGKNQIAGASNTGGNPLIAGRIAFNFLDPEPNPAYYTSSTYFGTADVLTLAIAGQHQTDGVGTAFQRADFSAWNIDALFEKRLGDSGMYGTVTLEGAYYRYYTGGIRDVATNFNNARSHDLVGGQTQGGAYLLGAGYLIPYEIGWGKLQPNFRFQQFNASLFRTSERQYDYGLTYVIRGHNARVTANYGINEFSNRNNIRLFTLGLQIQF